MPPQSITAATTAVTSTITNILPSASATIQKLETTYGPQAKALGQTAAIFYFSNLTLFQIISVILTLLFIAAIIYVLIETGYLALRIDRIQDVVLKTDTSKKRMQSSWDDIEQHFFAGDDNDLKIALIEADHLLNEALRGAGVVGKELGDRLKKVTPEQLPNVEEVWQAHKVRNRIAHEAGFVLKRDLAERALTVYETALKHLGALNTPTEENR
jgi:hypothetical protein